MAYRRYSDEDKAVALAALEAKGGNFVEAAKFAGVPRTNLQRWAAGEAVSDAVPEIGQEVKRSLADRLEEVAHKLLDAIPDRIDEASLMQCSTAMAIAVDKMQLLRGEATSISGTRDLSDEDKRARIKELSERHGLRVA